MVFQQASYPINCVLDWKLSLLEKRASRMEVSDLNSIFPHMTECTLIPVLPCFTQKEPAARLALLKNYGVKVPDD